MLIAVQSRKKRIRADLAQQCEALCLYNLQRNLMPDRNPQRWCSEARDLLALAGRIALLTLLCGISVSLAVPADRSINAAAAADLNAALQEIAANYEKRSGVEVRLSFGASGALTQQLQNGAPFDVFFSADAEYPRQLIMAGQAEAATVYRYAVGRLVIWTPRDSPLDVEHNGMDVLLDPSVKKLAIVNPPHAPYGRAAVAAMQHYGLYERIRERLVLGENVSQPAQFAESGNAQAGLVAWRTLSHWRNKVKGNTGWFRLTPIRRWSRQW